jgi:hypothetical protein
MAEGINGRNSYEKNTELHKPAPPTRMSERINGRNGYEKNTELHKPEGINGRHSRYTRSLMAERINGKNSYEKNTEWPYFKEFVREILIREEELRMNETTKMSYKTARLQNGEEGVFRIIENIQSQVSVEFNLDVECGKNLMRSVEYIFRDDPEFLLEIVAISHYRRYNILENGNLNICDKVPQLSVYHVDTKQKINLLNDSKKYQIILGGSITWPPFVEYIPKINEIIDKSPSCISWTLVYILEAHTTNHWPAGLDIDIKQHESMKDRLECVELLKTKYTMHPRMDICCDYIDDNFNKTYPSWPYRYWIIDSKEKTLLLKTLPENNYFTVNQLETWVSNLINKC